MSITSANQKSTHVQFSDLLLHYPKLASWLMEMIQSRTELHAEALLPSFLLECANQDIPGNVYPFTCKDRGLADLRVFLRNAHGELNAFAKSMPLASIGTPPVPAYQIASDEIPAIPVALDTGEIDDTPIAYAVASELGEIDDTPVVRKKGKIDETPVTHEAAGELGEIDDTPVVRRATSTSRTGDEHRVQAVDPSTSVTENIPVLRTVLPSRDAASQENSDLEATVDIAKQVTEQITNIPILAESVRVVEITKKNTFSDIAEAETIADIKVIAPDTKKERVDRQDVPQPSTRSKWARMRRPHTRRERFISWALLILVLGAILVPAVFLISFGISAYTTYRNVNDRAHSAVNHLLAVKTIFSGGQSHLTGIFDVAKLQQAEREFVASEQDFQQLQNQLQHSSTLDTVVTYFPQYRATVKSAQVASVIGIDVAKIGQIVATNATQLAPLFSGPLLSVSKKPLLTQSTLATIGVTLDQVLPLLNDIQVHAQGISLASLPISANEKTQVGALLQVLPQAVNDLSQVHSMLGTAGWLLGVDQPRTFLVQTMDRAELRATGGFTGQFGELKINGGRVEPFNLKDISLVEYANNSITYGQLAPEQYRSWWPFANWGMRDSNVSADFPTSAQIALQLYQQEVGTQADGVISFTPVAIEHILAVIGPITVPGYNVTATAQNLEDLLHYYQLDNSGILKQINQQPDDKETSTRKRFTNTLASLLMSKVRSAPPDALFAIANQVVSDLKTKDLQIYFTDPGAESLLTHYGYAGQMDRSTTHDGFYVVQENLSVSKASQFVQTIMHDTVTLNSQGGATHVLQVRLVYNQDGPVYGYDTYYDYLRIYTPPSSQLLWGDGFATNQPLCGGNYGSCPVNGAYPNGELTCPAGQYQPGASPPYLTDSNGSAWGALHTVAGPTNTTSDEPGRAMYGGWVIVPKNCTMNVTLSWYVPPMSQQPYSLLVQRQAGTFPELDLTILPSAANCASLHTAGMHFDDILTEDSSFTSTTSRGSKQGCYPS